MSDELLINVWEAARRLSLGRSRIYELIQSGELPSVKLGGSRRVLVSDLDAFVARLSKRTSRLTPLVKEQT